MEEAQRIRKLEEWASETRLQMAVRDERDKHVDLRFDRIEESQQRNHKEMKTEVGQINDKIGRVVWLMVAAILAALVNFIVQGGLSVGPFS